MEPISVNELAPVVRSSSVAPAGAHPVPHAPSANLKSQYAWALYEFARTPYVGLIFIFAFAPYFTNVVVGDPVHGQEIWSLANTLAGVCVGLLAPILGAVADKMGRRKPWIVATVCIMTPGCIALWFAMPGAVGGLPVVAVAAIIVALTTAFEFGQVFHNAFLTHLAAPKDLGRLSGIGIAMANIGALLATLILLIGIALPASQSIQSAFIPNQPILGLDTGSHEHDRFVGPLSGLWLLVFTIPFLLWTPDQKATGMPLRRAVGSGLRQLWTTVKYARQMSNIGLYLLARMLYNDGLVAIQAYSGIIAAGIFKWGLTELLLFGISLAPFTIGGGYLLGWLDRVVGTRRAIQLSVLGSGVFTVGAISMTPTRLFFFIPYDAASAGPLWSFPFFQTLPEVLFVVMYMALALMVTVAFAASRAMMARLSPVSMVGQFFGLFAVSGVATAFLGHGLVAFFTKVSGSQQIGFSSLLILLIVAGFLMGKVREERAQEVVE